MRELNDLHFFAAMAMAMAKAGQLFACAGRAMIITVARNGRNFIQSVKALNGC